MSARILRQITQLDQQIGHLLEYERYQEAIPLASQLHDLIERHLGKDHPDYGKILNTLGALYYKIDNYDVAEPFLRQALVILGETIGEYNLSFATALNTLGLLYYSTGEYAAAEPLYKRAIEICRKVGGEQNPHLAKFINNLALLYKSMGDYTAAEPLYKRARDILNTVLGEQHPDFAMSLDNLAGLYEAIGDYRSAESLCKRAGEIYRAVCGDQHPDFALSLNNLAGLYETMGEYAKAKSLHEQAIAIQRKVLGKRHPDLATSLNNLAILYKSMGDYAAAEPLYKESIEIYCGINKHHPNYAASLNNLAILYAKMGKDRYVSAETRCKQAMEIERAVLGEQHPSFATSLNTLAGLYKAMGKYAVAEWHYKQAMKIRRRVLGERHPAFASSLNNLAELYLSMGDYAKAEPLHRQALEVRRVIFGEQHPDFAASLNNLSAIFAANGRNAEAKSIMEQALAIDDRMIGQVFSISSEKQRTVYLNTIKGEFQVFLSLISQCFSNSPEAVQSALSIVLRRKAIEAEALAAQRDAVLSGKYPEVAPKLREITIMRAQVAQKTLSGPGKEGLQTHQQLLAEWNAKKEKLEAELARHVPEMNLEQKLRAADRQAVALAIPEEATLIEFVRFNVFDFKAVPVRGESQWKLVRYLAFIRLFRSKPPLTKKSQWKPAHYLAFILPAREPDNVQMIDLGEAEPIDRMIATFRSTITDEAENRGKRDLGALPSKPVGESDTNDGAALRAALFDAILPAIGNRKRLLLAPDGDLTRLPFEALPTDDGRRLIDDYQISYLGVGRDVLRFGAPSSGQPTAALVAADPDFDLSVGQAHAQATSETPGVAQRGRVSREIHAGDLERLGRLPGTRVEGERIARMLGVKPLLGEKALEASIKACRSPRILHLATHGFFLADRRRDPNRELRGPGLLGGQAGDGFGQMPKSMLDRMSGPGMENPLLRSGVLLAGFKTWLKGGSLPAEAEDGLLTAEDVSGLDLLATELVVLSACETGLGEVRTGEGVFGLRRAFVLAGAKTLVMSLWKVPDLATAILMERFYDYLLNRRDSLDRPFSRSESLREAQFHTRDVTIGQIRDRWLNAEMIERLSAGDEETREYLERLARRPDNHCPFTHPKFWGAFICQGDPGPLPMRD